jgi:hypothetical protein
LQAGDAVKLEAVERIALQAREDAEFLLFDMPLAD